MSLLSVKNLKKSYGGVAAVADVSFDLPAGQLLALAVGSPKRASALPDVPTTAEAGVPNSEFNFWIGLMAPAGTPAEVVNKLSMAIRASLQKPEIQERLKGLGAVMVGSSPQEYQACVKQDSQRWAALIKAADLKAE